MYSLERYELAMKIFVTENAPYEFALNRKAAGLMLKYSTVEHTEQNKWNALNYLSELFEKAKSVSEKGFITLCMNEIIQEN